MYLSLGSDVFGLQPSEIVSRWVWGRKVSAATPSTQNTLIYKCRNGINKIQQTTCSKFCRRLRAHQTWRQPILPTTRNALTWNCFSLVAFSRWTNYHNNFGGDICAVVHNSDVWFSVQWTNRTLAIFHICIISAFAWNKLFGFNTAFNNYEIWIFSSLNVWSVSFKLQLFYSTEKIFDGVNIWEMEILLTASYRIGRKNCTIKRGREIDDDISIYY